jgi:hypothetical protein
LRELLFDEDVVRVCGHLATAQRSDHSQQLEHAPKAGNLREDSLRAPDHPSGLDVVRRLVPGANQTTVLVNRSTGQIGAQVSAAPGHCEVFTVVAYGVPADTCHAARWQIARGAHAFSGHGLTLSRGTELTGIRRSPFALTLSLIEGVEPEAGLLEVWESSVEVGCAVLAQEINSFSTGKAQGLCHQLPTDSFGTPRPVDRDVRQIRLEFAVAKELGEAEDEIALCRDDRRYARRRKHSDCTCRIGRERWPSFGFAAAKNSLEMLLSLESL